MSQWYPVEFKVDDVLYLTAEHWMMVAIRNVGRVKLGFVLCARYLESPNT